VSGPVWTIVVAAGSGDRFGGRKQFLRLGGVRLVDRAVALARGCSDGVVVVLPPGGAAEWPDTPAAVSAASASAVSAVDGGATRAESVRAGLAAVPAEAAIVVVHDAARPLADAALYARVVAAVRAGADGAVPAVPVADTLKRVEGDRITATVPRDGLWAVQTPQAFRAAALREAHAAGGDATDDAALVEQRGGRVVVVPGTARNLKITVADDVEIATALLGMG
jgi:2-C-methyl-D-erythritol 4-phosphate cytidylyltransferase